MYHTMLYHRYLFFYFIMYLFSYVMCILKTLLTIC